jgi:hypothetical protein
MSGTKHNTYIRLRLLLHSPQLFPESVDLLFEAILRVFERGDAISRLVQYLRTLGRQRRLHESQTDMISETRCLH